MSAREFVSSPDLTVERIFTRDPLGDACSVCHVEPTLSGDERTCVSCGLLAARAEALAILATIRARLAAEPTLTLRAARLAVSTTPAVDYELFSICTIEHGIPADVCGPAAVRAVDGVLVGGAS